MRHRQPPNRPRRPLYQDVKAHVLDRMQREAWPPHYRVPSENALVARLGVSRMTVNRALRELSHEGRLFRVQGVGTFVAPGYEHRLESGLERLESILELAARQGLQVRIERLDVRQIGADAQVAERLQVPPGTEG